MADEDLRASLQSSIHKKNKIVFNVSPVISESQTVKYQPYPVSHLPGDIQSYGGTASRAFSMNGVRLVSRSPVEASLNLGYLNLLRSWTKPYFGSTISGDLSADNIANANAAVFGADAQVTALAAASADLPFGSKLGAPPDILYLSAYATSTKKYNLYKIPVVITSLSFSYPNDINYIPSTDGIPFPAIITIEISMLETHSTNEYSTFDLAKYKNGILNNF